VDLEHGEEILEETLVVVLGLEGHPVVAIHGEIIMVVQQAQEEALVQVEVPGQEALVEPPVLAEIPGQEDQIQEDQIQEEPPIMEEVPGQVVLPTMEDPQAQEEHQEQEEAPGQVEIHGETMEDQQAQEGPQALVEIPGQEDQQAREEHLVVEEVLGQVVLQIMEDLQALVAQGLLVDHLALEQVDLEALVHGGITTAGLQGQTLGMEEAHGALILEMGEAPTLEVAQEPIPGELEMGCPT